MAEADIKLLNAKRGQIKSQVTRFQQYLSGEVNIDELKLRLDRFETLLDKFNEIQFKLEEKKGTEEIDERIDFENSFYGLLARSKSLITERPNNFRAEIKLPAVSIPKFSGKIEKWMHFRDSFMSLIDKNASLNELQKFHYLSASLEGDASKLISSLEITEYNYKIALELLRNRYENTKLIINFHIKSIFNLPNINRENANQLRNLVDESQLHLRAIKKFVSTENWDVLIIHIISSKLDANTRSIWESTKTAEDIPTLSELCNCIISRAQVLESLNKQENSQESYHKYGKPKVNLLSYNADTLCKICKASGHEIHSCSKFYQLDSMERLAIAKKLKVCFNCLRQGHYPSACHLKKHCKKCDKYHNTLLHDSLTNQRQMNSAPSTNHSSIGGDKFVLLATVNITVQDHYGNNHVARALLDSGSQSNFITKKFCSTLQKKCHKINIPVSGLHSSLTHIKETTDLQICSQNGQFRREISCLVLDEITGKLPQISINKKAFKIPDGLALADPKFDQCASVDMLLGAEIFWDSLSPDRVNLGHGNPILQRTEFGWILSGSMTSQKPATATSCHVSFNSLNNSLEKFWNVEEIPIPKPRSLEEQACEMQFDKTHTRDETGRFQVSLPFRANLNQLGETFFIAEKRLNSMYKRFYTNPTLEIAYSEFLHEYENLGHMTECPPPEIGQRVYYLPHHAVFKESSTTTKIRVVFDGSAKPAKGLCLNKVLMVGPSIQSELYKHLIYFRMHQFAITADITKMYRQINISPEDRDYQRILWRRHGETRLRHFQLNTITYGLAPSSYQATRCLQQLGMTNSNNFPRASEALIQNFYMDDLLTGGDQIEDCLDLKRELTSLLSSAGMELRKWRSNLPLINDAIEPGVAPVHTPQEEKILGLLWDNKTDVFSYSLNIEKTSHVTKRTILSVIAKLYDPLGLLGPIIVQAKLIMQELWKLTLGWDETVPDNITASWRNFSISLEKINIITIPRKIICSEAVNLELHGFCDASEVAYGACVYLRSSNMLNQHHSYLVCAKSRVAPLKKLTLPRLELCSAQLLVKLMNNVKSALNLKQVRCTLWSDSTISLGWIAGEPYRWTTFVANRVSEIQTDGEEFQWRHVSSEDNPADGLSRGLPSHELIPCQSWWSGPTWLTADETTWPISRLQPSTDLPEKKREIVVLVTTVHEEWNIFQRFSSLHRLKRVVAYMRRFMNNTNKKNAKLRGELSVSELEDSLKFLILNAQRYSFATEYNILSQGGIIDNNSNLKSLNPIMLNGLLCVGGRLTHSKYIHLSQKHPILLPSRHPLTKLIIRSYHYNNFHVGYITLLSLMRLQYWPIHAANAIKDVIRKCIVCFRYRPMTGQQLMGDLPSDRLNPCLPFTVTGVDYAGPVAVKASLKRNAPGAKAYICLFICLVTKAVHLELVTDLTTDSFLNSLKRFISRRGLPCRIYSDNGTNFVGANREIKELYEFLRKSKDDIHNFLAQKSVQWYFIPPRAPHFGGLWERAISSMKTHLKKVLGTMLLSYEGLYTLLVQIEGILNSRPLSPLSSDPNDLNPLTPAHFLTGGRLLALPERDIQHLPTNLCNQYQKLITLYQSFWVRWSREYISQLQCRSKWKSHCRDLHAKDLVLIADDNCPPQLWRTGRVICTHPGPDGRVRVVTLRTTAGETKRSITKLCLLPIDELPTASRLVEDVELPKP